MRDPLLALPALLAMVMLTTAAPARSTEMFTMALCAGGTTSVPRNAPAGRDCDTACHAGCQRRSGRIRSFG